MNIWNRIAAAITSPKTGGSTPKGGGASTSGGTLTPLAKQPMMPLIETPKASNKQLTIPAYAPTATYLAAPLQRKDINAANLDISATSRLGQTTPAVIRSLARLNPDLSAAVNAYIRLGIPEVYSAVATNMDGSINREATQLALSILRQIDLMPDYASGFSQVSSLRSFCESAAKELLLEGAYAFELVLDKMYLPYKFQPVAVSQVIFREDKNVQGILAQQYIGGQYIDLDQPTFFYTSLDQDLLTAYAASPMEASVQPVLAASSFLQDMRRICARHVFPRHDVTIDEEKLRKRIPPEVANDSDKLEAFLNSVIDDVETVVNRMGVEEALVHFDFISITYIKDSSGDNAQSFETVKSIYDEKVSTGAKTLPSILGHGSGSQNVASTETLMFALSANGMVRLKLQEGLSKAMTLAIRLFGMDVTVKFQFEEINLRPKDELEAFKAMKQSRILEQLSLGFLSDDEAALQLTGKLTPDGFTPLSGTGFFKSQPSQDLTKNPLGNQQGTMSQSLKPDTPQKTKGK